MNTASRRKETGVLIFFKTPCQYFAVCVQVEVKKSMTYVLNFDEIWLQLRNTK